MFNLVRRLSLASFAYSAKDACVGLKELNAGGSLLQALF
jgi:hypothetical protein